MIPDQDEIEQMDLLPKGRSEKIGNGQDCCGLAGCDIDMYFRSRQMAGLDGRFDDGARTRFGLVGGGKVRYPDPQKHETERDRKQNGAAEGSVRHLSSESSHWHDKLHQMRIICKRSAPIPGQTALKVRQALQMRAEDHTHFSCHIIVCQGVGRDRTVVGRTTLLTTPCPAWYMAIVVAYVQSIRRGAGHSGCTIQ